MLHRRRSVGEFKRDREGFAGGVFRVLFRLVGKKPKREAAALDIAQDRVLRFEDGRLDWL